MASSEVAIANLVYRYAELIDSGDLEATAQLFAHARVYMGPDLGEVGAETVLEMWRKSFIFHENGSPRCKHVITNPIIEVDEEAGQRHLPVLLHGDAAGRRRSA